MGIAGLEGFLGRWMRLSAWAACAAVPWLAASADALGGVGPTNCGIMYKLRDNLTIKADVSDSQLRFDKQCSFRVYLYNTMSHPFWNAKLEVLSDQFEAAVVPSPLWKTYPDVQSAATGGTREHFTVTLKRKAGVPDGQYDVSLRVYPCYETPKLNAVLTVAEAMDQHEMLLGPPVKMDGRVRPQDWNVAPALTDFSSYVKNREQEFFFCRPTDQTRVHVAADRDNLYLLVTCMGTYDRGVKGNEVRIYAAPAIEAKSRIFTLDESTGQVDADQPAPGLQCVKCQDDPEAPGSVAVYEIRIPRRSLGMTRDVVYLNFCRIVAGRLPAKDRQGKPMPEFSFWRGNDLSAKDPVVFGRIVIHDKR
jgi:hypothetical protein